MDSNKAYLAGIAWGAWDMAGRGVTGNWSRAQRIGYARLVLLANRNNDCARGYADAALMALGEEL